MASMGHIYLLLLWHPCDRKITQELVKHIEFILGKIAYDEL